MTERQSDCEAEAEAGAVGYGLSASEFAVAFARLSYETDLLLRFGPTEERGRTSTEAGRSDRWRRQRKRKSIRGYGTT